MTGCIYNTNREWFEYIREGEIDSKVNFWRKNTSQFKMIKPGEYFWFRVKTKHGKRKILGYGIYEKYEVLTIEKAWEKYEEGNGAPTKEKFLELMRQSQFGKNLNFKSRIGCIVLNDVRCFEDDEGIDLEKVGIKFSKNIVSGKRVDDENLKRIAQATIPEEDFETPEIDVEDKEKLVNYLKRINEKYKEATLAMKARISKRIERDPRITNFLKKLYDKCQICGEEFFLKKDGKTRYSEVHHIKSLSEGGGLITDNCIVVCANCHRKMHYARVFIGKEKDYFIIKINDEPEKRARINKVELLTNA